MNYYDYSLIRYMPDARRGEVVNIGILVYRPQQVDVQLLPNLAKARQLDASLSIRDLDELPRVINTLVASTASADEMYALIADLGSIKLSKPAYFVANTTEEYATRIREIMRDLVTPKSAKATEKPQGRLITALKKQFQHMRLLAEPGIDVSKNHLVSFGYPVDEDSELVVDFAQKNGRWHVTQTIDYKVKKLPGKFKEVGIKSIGLDQAQKHLGKDTMRYCIIDVPDDAQSVVQGQINLLSNYAEHVLYYGSAEDMTFYWENALAVAQLASSQTNLS
jgi:hypothetical protein